MRRFCCVECSLSGTSERNLVEGVSGKKCKAEKTTSHGIWGGGLFPRGLSGSQ